MSIAAFKKASSSNLDALNEKINSILNPSFQSNDERFWQPSVDKAGNGYAVIRFLPSADGPDEIPFVRVWDHGFKGPGGWYIENSLTTIDKPDPVSEYNAQLWNTELKANRDFVSGTPDKPGSKRRLHFTANILVIDDPVKPENNGKVFLYKFGKKIFNKIKNAMNPKVPNLPKMNPFDMWKGADFTIIIQKVEGQRNYDESKFLEPKAIAEKDADIEKIWKQTHSLKEFVDPSNFKTYEELAAKLDRVLNPGFKPRAKTVEQAEVVPQSFSVKPEPKVDEASPPWDTDDGDDELASFRKLVNED